MLTHEVLELHELDCGGANLLCAEHFHIALETGKEMLASSLAAAYPKILFLLLFLLHFLSAHAQKIRKAREPLKRNFSSVSTSVAMREEKLWTENESLVMK